MQLSHICIVLDFNSICSVIYTVVISWILSAVQYHSNYYRFSLSHDDCSTCCCCCLFVVSCSAAGRSKPRSFSTCADCLRRMMLRGVLELRGATKLQGASGDLWLVELDPNSLLLAGLTAYDIGRLLDDFSLTASAAVSLTATVNSTSYTSSLMFFWHHINKQNK